MTIEVSTSARTERTVREYGNGWHTLAGAPSGRPLRVTPHLGALALLTLALAPPSSATRRMGGRTAGTVIRVR